MIGYKLTDSRKPDLDELAGQLAALWEKDNIAGLIFAMKPGITQVKEVMKVLYPGKDGKFEREDMTELCTVPAPTSRFTTW